MNAFASATAASKILCCSAARARGEGTGYIAWVEIFPNMVNPMLADFGLRFVFVVLLLSGMSFLGLGV